MGIGGGFEAVEVAEPGSGAVSDVTGLLLDAKGVTEKIPGNPEQHRPGIPAPSARACPEPVQDAVGGALNDPLSDALDDGAAALETLRDTALPAARMFDVGEAADFAGRVEDLARTLEYLQIVAAQAVERTREEAKHARTASASTDGSTGWRTGWTENDAPTGQSPHTNGPHTTNSNSSGTGAGAAVGGASITGAVTGAGVTGAVSGAGAVGSTSVTGVPARGSILDDGYRNAAEFLRARLRIEIREARRRLSQAAALLPTTTLTGEPLPPRHTELAQALATALIPSRTATIITGALDQAALIAHPETLTAMEHALTRTGIETDPDFVSKTARRWINRIDQDGPEPSEEELRTLQGAFIRKPRRGLHHIEIFATTEQYETLTTLMNTATNPRLTPNTTTTDHSTQATTAPPQETTTTTPATTTTTHTTHQAGQAGQGGQGGQGGQVLELDRRSRAQKLLDGLVGGCALALKTGRLPANGGLKPQLTAYINAHELLPQLQTNPTNPAPDTTSTTRTNPGTTGPGSAPSNHTAPGTTSNTVTAPGTTGTTGRALSSASATFAGPIHPSTLRKIACDADILPVLLGS
ncbi:DUF222 domain-containing protein, partial [Paenarthrobacter sp. NPDC090522]|uniref:DUF222 domain-containing protein n=1 Tax=Paenarthrobacter sp. NPDC090522 TaxID=3364383 RepID=UPI0037F37E88